MDDRELRAFQQMARRKGLKLSEWVRQTLRQGGRTEASRDPARKIAAIRAASRHAAPTGDIDQMLAEIEHGYISGHRD